VSAPPIAPDAARGRTRRRPHPGSSTIVERFPEDDVTVIVLANRGDIDLKSLALQIAESELGR
jgi:hypothetical protein